MKLILSRKGFDSASGGVASPILPAGSLCSLPIPDAQSGLCYADIQFDGRSLGALVPDLSRGRVTAGDTAHLDPDVNPESLARAAGWKPIFGQSGAARGHLRNQGVGPGDLFLFYGWFRQTEWAGGRLRYVTDAPDLHVVYGWLQIETRIPVMERERVPAWAAYHVHLQRKPTYWDDSVYIATERLALPGLTAEWPGGGVFPQYDARLRLTAAGHTRSIWCLPRWFHPFDPTPRSAHLTYHGNPDKWTIAGDRVLLDCAKQGQEFVLDCDAYPEAVPWVVSLFKAAASTT